MRYSAVFDTSTLFSGFGWPGKPFRCLQLASAGICISITCPEIVVEFEQKLVDKKGISPADAAVQEKIFLSFSQSVMISNTLKVVLADPADEKILECGVVGGATHIVTGDRRHLLPLGSYGGIAIVSPAEFLKLFSVP